ncbi:MAG: phosphate acyltransferase PlsX [Capsulimonadaceae bacterium]
MIVAVDAMGGDFAPEEVVKGALLVSAEHPDVEIVLVGDVTRVNAELAKASSVSSRVSVRHASEVISMTDHPAAAIRKKRDSSLVVAALMVKSGQADATFSAGNTGAAMALATLEMGRIAGIDRPAIGATLPASTGCFLLLDAGANVDCSTENLAQFALVGSIYAGKVMGVENPRVGLLNIGGEPGKGNELAKESHARLSAMPLHFIGNVEGKDIFEGVADVVVCDGFAGNVFLKAGEGVAEMILNFLQQELPSESLPEAASTVVLSALERLKRRIDYSEYGGAPLLGVNGVSVIGHGRSHAKAIASGIAIALRGAESDFVAAIRGALSGRIEVRI